MRSEDHPSGSGALRPRARLIRTLGADLISSEKVAITELVKNSYDADASAVLVRFQGEPREGTGSIQIWDDGCGMDVSTLANSWLEIATDFKTRRTRSPSGSRRVLGEKGIGRLAGARLADEMLLTTRKASAQEIQLLIDWRAFDRPGAYLDEVEVAWDVGLPRVFSPSGDASRAFADAGIARWAKGHGTLIDLTNLTHSWDRDDFQDLRTVLSRLVHPLPGIHSAEIVDDFKVVLDLPAEYEDLSGEITPPEELSSAPYRLTGTVSRTGLARLTYSQLEPQHSEIFTQELWTTKTRAPEVGPFDFDIQVFDRDRESLAQLGSAPYNYLRQVLDQASGVSVYRDGFRVLPFGEPGDDWLTLDRRRVQNPTMRVSNNQVIGHVFISADENPTLRDQSNREGLIEARGYEDLKVMLRAALALIETRRYSVRRRMGASRAAERGLFQRFNLSEVRDALASAYPNDANINMLLADKDQEIKTGIEEVQRALGQYSRLATLGSLVDRVVHDGRTAVTHLKNIVRFGKRDLANSAKPLQEKLELAENFLDETDVQADLLATLFRQITPFSGRRRGRPKTESLLKLVKNAKAMLESEIADVNAVVNVRGEDIDIRADYSEILNVVVNLLRNSLYWLSTLPETLTREVDVDLRRASDGSVEISVSDSGPGVPDATRDQIFDAYFSTKPDGVGLGLSIAGDIASEFYGGSLRLVDGGPLPGATFIATLRRRV